MSFDAFEIRMQFLQLLRKLNASSQSIQKVISFALKNGPRAGEDLWEVALEECAKGTLNTRINILYFLDGLCEACLALGQEAGGYLGFVVRDLGEIVGRVVPDTREGVLNLRSAKQILESWRTRRVIDSSIIDEVLESLDKRSFEGSSSPKKRGHSEAFSRNDILRRMEEDRERHKRLRERIWILPIPSLVPKPTSLPPAGPSSTPTLSGSSSNPSPASPFTPASPSSRPPATTSTTPGSSLNPAAITGGGGAAAGKMLPPPAPSKNGTEQNGLNALEMEFEQTWESTGELTSDDWDGMKRDAAVAGLLG